MSADAAFWLCLNPPETGRIRLCARSVLLKKWMSFRNSVVTFTDAIFTDGQYVERIMSFASNCQEIVFCVGHPTKWDELDVAVYKAILGSSILGRGEYHGKPSSLVMAAESRAAFLYAKNQGKATN